MVGGAVVVLVILALAGASLDGEAWWAIVAGAFACASGLVLGLTRRALPAAGLALVAVAAVAVAAGDGGAAREAAPAVRHEIVRPAGPGEAAGENPRPAIGDEARGRDEAEAPAAPPATVPPRQEKAAAREALVRSYYAALDAHEYAAAWRRLSPSVQAAFGGFEAWRLGYATTVAHRVEEVRVDGDAVALVLVATDRTPCGGTTEQRFSVAWRLEGRTAVALTAARLGGLDPASACG